MLSLQQTALNSPLACCCRVPWGGALLSLEPAQEELHPDVDQVILCGLAAQIGIAQDPIDSLSPHATTGR